MKFDVWKDILSQTSYFKSQLDLVTLGEFGEGNLKSWEMLRVEGLGWNLVGKISTSPRYMIDITQIDPLSLGSLGGGANSEKLVIFNLWRSDWILMKFDVWKDIVSQSSYLKFRPDKVTLGGDGGRELKSWKTLRVEGSGWNVVGKIITSPRYMIDITRTDLLSLAELVRGSILKNQKKRGIFNLWWSD